MPTAQTLPAETAATLRSTLVASAPALGLGLATSLHVEPFQCRMKVAVPPDEARFDPTAQASVREIALTASRLLRPAGCGVATTPQLVPSQCSIRFDWSPTPTAQTSLGPEPLTPVR